MPLCLTSAPFYLHFWLTLRVFRSINCRPKIQKRPYTVRVLIGTNHLLAITAGLILTSRTQRPGVLRQLWLPSLLFLICVLMLAVLLQTVEPRNNYSTRASDVLSAGAHFVQTSFPTTPTLFPSTYSVSLSNMQLPIRGENIILCKDACTLLGAVQSSQHVCPQQ